MTSSSRKNTTARPLKPKPAITSVQKALGLHRAAKFSQAAHVFRTILNLQPKQYALWLPYIESLILSEQHDQARTALQQCRNLGFATPDLDVLEAKIGIPPRHREQALIDLYQNGGRQTELAARIFIAQYPHWPLGWDILGAALQRDELLEAALQARSEAVSRFPVNVEFKVKLALTSQALKQFDAAEQTLREAFAQAPDRVDILAHVGYLHQQQGDLKKAEEIYRQCVTLAPDNAAMHSNLGELLLGTGRILEAQIEIQQAVRLDPDLAEAQCNLGHLERKLGRYEAAIAAYQRALELKPELTEAHEALLELAHRR